MATQHPSKRHRPQTPASPSDMPAQAAQASATGSPVTEALRVELTTALQAESFLRWLTWLLALMVICIPVLQAFGQLHSPTRPTGTSAASLTDVWAMVVGCLVLPALNALANKVQHRVAVVTKQLDSR
jgi:hypothetical protein